MTEPTSEPVHVSKVIGSEFGTTREATCGCGASYTQTKFIAGWVPPACDKCLGRLAVERADESSAATIRTRLAALEIPPRYRDASLDNYRIHGSPEDEKRQARVLQLARRYLGSWPNVASVIVFRGSPGSGKGHIAWSLVKTLVHVHDITARVCKLPDVIRDLREAWRNEGGLSEAQRLAKYRQPDLLVIDEVSRHAFYGEPRQHLYDLVDHRDEQLRPTILTTNEDGAGLAELLGPALVSRVAGSGLWEFGSADFRLRPPA